ncbi:uncharacterized protein METZ01_LOCUS260062 [marine metagenome]|uniref:Uncharacterized protein n=1 Tax=marine metagenome TaxID=408172 RepID=A0A382J5Y9_9ZZZZ
MKKSILIAGLVVVWLIALSNLLPSLIAALINTEVDLDQFLYDLDQFQNQYQSIAFIINGY